MTIHPQIDEQSSGGRIRLEWDNRQMPKLRFAFWFMIVFWIIWAPLTCAVMVMIFMPGTPKLFLIIWSIGGWVGTLGIPWTLARRWWREWITLDSESIAWGEQGLLWRNCKSIPLQAVQEVGFGKVSDDSESEGWVTLNVLLKQRRLGSRSRHLLAYWLASPYKWQIFEAIRKHAERERLPVTFRVYDS